MNIEELKRLAEAATPGPWVSHPKGYYGAVCRADDQYDLVAVTHGQRRNNVLANEAYIAAANPATILELIRQLQAAREILPVLKALVADIQGMMSESHGVTGLHLNGDVAPWGELEPGGRLERLGSLQTAIELIIKTED